MFVGEGAPARGNEGRAPATLRAGAALGALWAAGIWGLPFFVRILHALNRLAFADGLGKWVYSALGDAINATAQILALRVVPGALLFVSLAIPLGVLARVVSRARVRAGLRDPLDALRALATHRPRLWRAITAAPGLLALGVFVRHAAAYTRDWGGPSMYGEYAGSPLVSAMHTVFAEGMAGFAMLGGIAAIAAYAVARSGARALIAPTAATARGEKVEDRFLFDAVAVTPETRAAVMGMAVLPFAVLGLVAFFSPFFPGLDLAPPAIALYVALAVSATLMFRRSSRIAVGLDGVLVSGSSPTRFYAYRDLASAAVSAGEIRLRTREGAGVRLQPHGEDAAQRAAILERIQGGIDAARAELSGPAGTVVAGASADDLVRLAEGANDYRAPALTREQLWEVVEGPEHAASTRAAAARALAATGSDDARSRLRRIADHSAEPRVRVELVRLAEEAELEEEDPSQGTEAKRRAP